MVLRYMYKKKDSPSPYYTTNLIKSMYNIINEIRDDDIFF